jgi:hypothetical protein
LATAVALGSAALLASAHVGTNDAFYDGAAGPYAVRVVVRMPPVIPEQAELTARIAPGGPAGDVRRVFVQVAR